MQILLLLFMLRFYSAHDIKNTNVKMQTIHSAIQTIYMYIFNNIFTIFSEKKKKYKKIPFRNKTT